MITVYSESTPNPSAMKFVASSMLLQDGIEEYWDAKETSNCKLAAKLFTYPFVKSVFITANFISVHKNEGIEWFEVHNEIRQMISDYLNSGEPLFTGRTEPVTQTENANPSTNKAVEDVPSSELDSKISEILNEYVRPAVESDGGAIQFKSYDEGKVTVTLRGACSGCPSSSLTLKSGIENLLKQMLPGKITEVVAEEL